MDDKKPKEPGTPEPVDNDDTTPIDAAHSYRYFDSSSQGLRCMGCNHYLTWTDVSGVWWCLDVLCRMYRKVPKRS